MCFDRCMLWASCLVGSAELVYCIGFVFAHVYVFVCGFFCSLVDFYTELEGLGYVKPKGLGCVKDASTRCARLLAPEFFGMSICTLERMLGSSLLRGELHPGMAKG